MTKSKKWKRLTPSQWKEARHKYITTKISARELAEEYDVQHNTVRQRMSREKWTQRRKEHLALQDAARVGAIGHALTLSKRTQAQTRINYAERAQVLAKLVVDEAERLAASRKLNPTELEKLARAVRICQQVEFASLGIAEKLVTLSDDDEEAEVLTWEEHMQREREKSQLKPYKFERLPAPDAA